MGGIGCASLNCQVGLITTTRRILNTKFVGSAMDLPMFFLFIYYLLYIYKIEILL